MTNLMMIFFFTTGSHRLNTGSTGAREKPHNAKVESKPSKKMDEECSGDNVKSPIREEEPRTFKLGAYEKRLVTFAKGWKELKNDNE